MQPFSQGGNRLCFVHPDNPDRCLKVLTEKSDPVKKRKEKGFPASLRPLNAFDENWLEWTTLTHLWSKYPERITRHLPRSYGIAATDLGNAHEVSLIRDNDGRISQTLEQYLWNTGLDDQIKTIIDRFRDDWGDNAPYSRALLPHNFVVRLTGETADLVLIDGYGRPEKLPLPSFWKRHRARSQIQNMSARIETVLNRKRNDEEPKPRIFIINRNA